MIIGRRKIAPAATSPTANKLEVSKPENRSPIPPPLNNPFKDVSGI